MSHVSFSLIKAKIISANLLEALSASPLALECRAPRKTLFFFSATNGSGALEPALSLAIGCETLPKILG